MVWDNTYREGQISPVGTITETRPAHQLAKVITEIQDKTCTDVEVINNSGLVDVSADIQTNTLIISIVDRPQVDGETDGADENDGGDRLPTDGEEGMYLRFSPDGNHYWDYIRAVDFES